MAEKVLDFRLLQAHEIQVRAGQKTKKGDKIALLLYKDARADMERLDEQFGSYGWQREHKDVHGVSYCGVSLWDAEKKCWVTKWDAGEPSNTSPQKGEASDAFKRACVNWGIGRELYTAPRIYVDINTNLFDLRVTYIEYNDDRRIISLRIEDSKGTVIYQTGKGVQPAPVVNKGGAIYPSKEQRDTEKEHDEFTAILADIESIESYTNLVAYMKSDRVQKSPYKAAICNAGHGYAKRKGWEK